MRHVVFVKVYPEEHFPSLYTSAASLYSHSPHCVGVWSGYHISHTHIKVQNMEEVARTATPTILWTQEAVAVPWHG